MFGFLKRKGPNFKQQYDAIVALDDPIRFHLYLELLRSYEKEMNPDLAKVLAIQVTNHLMGDDFEKVYDSLTPDVRQKVDLIRHLIEVKCDEAMTRNIIVRELIIRFLMTTSIIYYCLFDKTFFDQPEMKNREDLIRKYESNDPKEIPEAESFDRFVDFAKNFLERSQQALNAKKS
jgi:hypothetical protein